jgi:ribosomal protein L29
MKKSQLKELQAKTEGELHKQILSSREDLAKQQVLVRSGKLKYTASLRDKRKKIACMLTILRQKELVKV